jgi:hypothetical protein
VGDLNGQVWLYTPDAGEWVGAERNRPLTSGDRLATDNDARADVRIGSTTVRLDAGTELEIVAVDDDHIGLQLHGGSVAVRLRDAEAANEFELRTGEGRFVVHGPGRYRFDRRDASSHLTVRSGEAVYEGPGSALTVYAGQHAEFWMENGAAQYSLTDPVNDTFASWTDQRDRNDRAQRGAAVRVARDGPGARTSTAMANGSRCPTTAPCGTRGWCRSAGRRTARATGSGSVRGAGPGSTTCRGASHRSTTAAGRTSARAGAGCRAPTCAAPVLRARTGRLGRRAARQRLVTSAPRAPAVGWFPLAPREVYVPTYRVTPRYVQHVNVTHVTNITNVTTIVNNPQGAVRRSTTQPPPPPCVTVVPQDVMVNRQPVAPVAARVATTPCCSSCSTSRERAALPAAPVAAPVAVEQRRMRIHDEPGRPAAARSARAGAAAAIPPVPPSGRFLDRTLRSAQQPPAPAVVAPAAPVRPPVSATLPQPPAAAVTPRPPQAPPVQQAPGRVVVPPPPVTQPGGAPQQAQAPSTGPGQASPQGREARSHQYRGRRL